MYVCMYVSIYLTTASDIGFEKGQCSLKYSLSLEALAVTRI
jgi:hypothetical protein